MKRIFLTILSLVFLFMTCSAQELRVFIQDSDGQFTNIRKSPNGAIVAKLPNQNGIMMDVESPKNGWWKIDDGIYWDPNEDGDTKLKGARSYWIHYSVIGVGTRNYGGQTLKLRKSPSRNSAAVFTFNEEIQLRPIDIKGDWVKVKTIDGKHTGWIEEEWLCGNSVTNCC